MSSLKEIAKECGVSMKTVSNVVNGAANVGPETRRKIEAAISKSGYVPSRAGRGLALGLDLAQPARFHSGRNIGCVLPRNFDRYADSYYSAIFRGIEKELRRGGHFLLFAETIDFLESKPVLANTLLSAESIDGLINFAKENEGLEFLKKRKAPSVPMVAIGKLDGMECVVVDKEQAIRLSLEHLRGLGRRAVGFLGGTSPINGRYEERFANFLAQAGALGFETRPEWMIGGGAGFASGHEAAQKLLSLEERPNAVLCVSDMTAIGAIHAFHEAGVAVPEEISVCGYDDIPEAQAVYPTLSTASVDKDAIGATAVETLLARIAKPDAPLTSRLLPVKFVARASSAELKRKAK